MGTRSVLVAIVVATFFCGDGANAATSLARNNEVKLRILDGAMELRDAELAIQPGLPIE